MTTEKPQRVRLDGPPCLGLAWIGGWLFSIGFLHVAFWGAVLAIGLWPYYLGLHFSADARIAVKAATKVTNYSGAMQGLVRLWPFRVELPRSASTAICQASSSHSGM